MDKQKQIEEMPNKSAYTSERQKIREYCHRIREAVNYKGNNDHEDVPSILWDFKEEVIAGYRKVEQGEWLYNKGHGIYKEAYYCSYCYYDTNDKTIFCPCCGRKMKGAE